MTTARRTLLALAVAVLALCALTGAAQAAATAQPELGRLSPAFVEALHDPLVTVGLGHVPSPVEVHVGDAAQARAARADTPAAFDLRAEGRLTAVKDQGEYATCWAFANVAALESRLMPADPAPDYSEDNLVGRSGYGTSRSWRYTYGGYDFMAVAYFARWAGPVAEADDPYATGSTYYDPHAAGPVQKHVQGVTVIPGRTTPLGNDLVKQLVVQNGALSVGMWWDDQYFDFSTDAYFDPYRDGENHGVAIVGWDDAYPAGNFGAVEQRPIGDGAFLVRNSWGPAFGDGGYFWVSYYDRSFAMEQGLGGLGGMTSYAVVEDADNHARVYQYDKLGVTAHAGFRSTRAWGANRFTAARTQTVTAAAFYTLASSTRYEVWAGRSLRALSLRSSGVSTLPGYLTVTLDKPLRVYRGKPFVVAVKLVSPGELHPLAIEYPQRNAAWLSGATARKGQSFISRNGTTWRDTTSLYARSNVCLKAFAD